MASFKRYFRQVGGSLAAAGRMMMRLEVPREAAGISYFSLIALFPAMLVLIALADTFLGWIDLHETVIQQIVSLFPGSNQFLRSTLDEITTPSPTVVISCIFVVIWSFSWIFTFIESAISRAWGIGNQRTFWESRLRSIALMALAGFGLLISAVMTVFVGAARARAAAHIAGSLKASDLMGWLASIFLLGTGLLIAVFVFAFVFKWAPHCKVFWREAFSAALVTTILWEIGSFIFGKLVPLFVYQRVYGTMGVVIALLAWIYTSNLIMLFGAHFSAQLHWMSSERTLPGAGVFSKGAAGHTRTLG